MSKNIEMKEKLSDGSYDPLYPKTTGGQVVGAVSDSEKLNGQLPSYYSKNENYSTTEVSTSRTWVDGKTIYKKVVSLGSLPNATQKTVSHGILNIDTIVKITGFAYRATTATTIPLPFVTPTLNANCIGIQCPDKTSILIETGSDRTLFSGYIVLEYTKTV